MKVHPNSTQQLDFEQIKQILAKYATNDVAKQYCLSLSSMNLNSGAEIATVLKEVEECRQLYIKQEEYNVPIISEIDTFLSIAAIQQSRLEALALGTIKQWLREFKEIKSYTKKYQQEAPMLFSKFREIEVPQKLIDAIGEAIDDNRELKENASPELAHAWSTKRNLQKQLRSRLQQLLRNAVKSGWSDASDLALRNNRLVIPLFANFKGRIKGIVQDISQSGQTIYIEPIESIQLNNKLREVEQQILKEEDKILRRLTALVHNYRQPLITLYDLTIHLDILKAKAKLALRWECAIPTISPKQETMHLINARHPLLLEKHKQNTGHVIPMNVLLNPEKHILLISGPNAGGKSVALKTVGLLQIMLQSGLLIPASPNSTMRFFSAIYTDIGDTQSLQNDLSTYTAHLSLMNELLREMDKNTLYLLDEFGSGTDPKIGGAIAEALLEAFIRHKSYGIITTHYGNLKTYAAANPAIENAAMAFDPVKLSPTYRLETGLPGKSYAIEAAKKVGLPNEVILTAKKRLEDTTLTVESLIGEMEVQKATLQTAIEENKAKHEELKRLLAHNRSQKEAIEKKRKQSLEQAKNDANQIIKAANAKIERTIREIKEAQAEKEQTKKLRKELSEMIHPITNKNTAQPITTETEPVVERIEGVRPESGDWVIIESNNTIGQVISVSGKRVILSLGEMHLTVKLRQVTKIKAPQTNHIKKNSGTILLEKKKNASYQLDIRGMRVEQALSTVTTFIDDATIAGLNEVHILHGKGTGALREAVRQHLDSFPQVRSMHDAHIEAGGAGWTICTLNT